MILLKGDPRSWLQKRLKPGDTVIDVGANEGRVTAMMAKAVGPTGTVHAIEPDPRCWETLAKNAPTAMIHRCAVGAEFQSVATLTQGRESPQSSLRAEAVLVSDTTVETPVYRLSTVVSGHVAAVKIDVQGWEYDVLRGARAQRATCPLWVVEVWPHGLPYGARTVEDMYDLMQLSQLYPHTLDDPPVRISREDLITWAAEADASKFVNLAWLRDGD